MASIKDLLSANKVKSVKKAIQEKSTSTTKEVLFSSTSENILEKEKSSFSKSTHIDSSAKKVSYQEEPEFHCDLYKDRIAPSINFQRELFTNFLPERFLIDSGTKSQINQIAENSDCISKNYDRKAAQKIRYSGKYKEHMKSIVKMYDSIFENEHNELSTALEDEFLVKATIEDDSGKGKTRVISFWEKKDDEHLLHMLFIDFYHLFLPSNHAGYDSDKQRRATYKMYANNPTCISKWLTTEKIKWLENN
ncbi:hypothetical protein P7E02_03950 [Enterococcus hulanensis]|uniref:hypothetical protein n=1 Tax=Enterococcus hulanensis TaxID=2559929 RepID=UPI0028927608|nr:hypothetical protein [Enterococcus hulanensis]MDT2659005.1 hypothetical protein [Enterococcus hulanensis]